MFTSVSIQTRTMAHAEAKLRQLLIKIAAEQKYEKPEIIIEETSSGGANYTSKLFNVIIREANKEDLHLFAKVATLGEKFRENVPVTVFDTERFAYMKLAKIYEGLEDKNGVPEEHRLYFTKCYGFDHRKYNETVVMENLLEQGYGPNDRFHSFDWEYASSSITNLANMHALSFAYRKTFPDEFEETLSILKMDWKEGAMDGMMKISMETALKNVRPEYKAALAKFLAQEVYQKDFLVKLCAPVRASVIIHADFRGSNLLHRVRKVSFIFI